MKKTIKQLKDSKNLALNTMQNLIDNAETEDRNLSTDEQNAWNEAETTATDMTARVDRLERSMNLTKTPVVPVTFETQNVAKTDKDLKRFSFSAACQAAYNGQMDGIVAEMHSEARNENKSRLFRGVGIPSIALEHRASQDLPAAAGNVRPTDVSSFIDQLQANLVMVQAGANFYSGITADRKFPIIGGITSGFIAEGGGSGQTAAGNIDEITLSPNKLISVVSMSAEMMTQNASAEAALQRNMARSFNTADALTIAASITKAELFAAEKNILAKNFNPASGNFAYIFNAGGLAKLKEEAGVDYVQAYADFASKTVNGYPYFVTQNLGTDDTDPSEAMMFGDYSDVHLATFGGLDIISDRYTDAAKGLSRLVIVSLVDGKVARKTATLTSLVKGVVA